LALYRDAALPLPDVSPPFLLLEAAFTRITCRKSQGSMKLTAPESIE
jgi:hypothetical protein